VLAGTPEREAYSAISPSGRSVAYGTVVPGELTVRPVTIVNTVDGSSRRLCRDCGGRPREWLDERTVIIETPGPKSSLVFVDVKSGGQRWRLESLTRSLSNPRVSFDRKWITFEARTLGAGSQVVVASIGSSGVVSESQWQVADRAASHPFWSHQSMFLYYLADQAHVRGRRFDAQSGRFVADGIPVFTAADLMIPIWLPGTTPTTTSNEIVFVVADVRGDVWMMDIAPVRR